MSKKDKRGIEFVSLSAGKVMLTDGDFFDISAWVDDLGDETSEMDEVAYITAGPDRDKMWWNIDTRIHKPIFLS